MKKNLIIFATLGIIFGGIASLVNFFWFEITTFAGCSNSENSTPFKHKWQLEQVVICLDTPTVEPKFDKETAIKIAKGYEDTEPSQPRNLKWRLT
ncbi:hypothetical protein [Ammoniphilus sp. 3BR4]|uniref:hypothetical protein n=1 Tax=Ammoniphilus sp. 3BR4 TaxID=3158265 RepID=UPI0034665C68